MDGGAHYLDGGFEIVGREIAPLNPGQIAECIRSIREAGVSAVALVGVFSPLDHDVLHEEACKRQMVALHPELNIVCSHGAGYWRGRMRRSSMRPFSQPRDGQSKVSRRP